MLDEILIPPVVPAAASISLLKAPTNVPFRDFNNDDDDVDD